MSICRFRAASESQLLLLLLCIVLPGCGGSPGHRFETLKEIHPTGVHRTSSDVLGVGRLSYCGGWMPSALSDTDQVIDSGLFQIPERASFEVWDVKLVENQGTQIEVVSLCDCLGFTKTILLPFVVMLDTNGNVIPTTNSVFEYRANSFELPAHIYAKWLVPSGYTKACLVVLSNNQKCGEKIGVIGQLGANNSAPMGAGVAASIAVSIMREVIPFFSAPMGRYCLKVESVPFFLKP